MLLRISIASIVLLVVWVIWCSLFPPKWLLHRLNKLHPILIFSVQTEDKVIALTIDDGPHPVVTEQILDVLEANGCNATFFLDGNRIKGNEHLLKRIVCSGSEIGNHLSQSWRPAALMPMAEFRRRYEEVQGLIRPYSDANLFRPSQGLFTKQMLQYLESEKSKCIVGSVYPHDIRVRNPKAIASLIEKQVFPGGIIVLHDGTSDRIRTAEVLKLVLPALKARGYSVVSVGELLKNES